MKEILYNEKQYFRQIWLWLIFLIIFVHINYLLLHNGLKGDIKDVILSNFPLLIFITLFWITNLKTKIDEKGIYFKFYPFHYGFVDKLENFIAFDSIEKMEIVTYNPIFDYGGWGIRFGGMNTTAYNTMGNKGLMIYKKKKEKVLIGTQKPELLNLIISKIEVN